MKSSLAVLVLLVFCCPLHAQTTQPVRPEPRIERVLIISVDGMRPDVLLRAEMPNLRWLFENGAFTFWARTTPVSVTLPSHTSMITGVPPEVHGVHENGDPKGPISYPKVPTLFQLAKRAGYTTAMCAGKSKFITLVVPGSLDHVSVPRRGSTDAQVASQAATIILEHKPQVMLVHLPSSDSSGHSIGWGSPQHVKTLAGTDRAIGRILDALRQTGVFDSTLIIVTADHGGAGRTHGPDDVRSRTIPWIVSGPGIRKNFDLARLGRDHNVETYDTFATACAVLGIPVEGEITGKFVTEILDQRELLQKEAAAR